MRRSSKDLFLYLGQFHASRVAERGGFVNKQNLHGRAANHIAKIVLASLLFLVSGAISFWRWRNPRLFHNRGKAIYVVGYFVAFALAVVLGFLGGVVMCGFYPVSLLIPDS